MKIEEKYLIAAEPDRVWEMLNDPLVLKDCIPGCRSLEPDGRGAFEAELSVGIGIIRGTYGGRIEIVDPKPVSSYRLKVTGEGPGGYISGSALVTLEPAAAGQTSVAVAGEGEIGGLLARVGQRLTGQASKTLMSQFFGCIAKKARAG